jgi:hypothetical protein
MKVIIDIKNAGPVLGVAELLLTIPNCSFSTDPLGRDNLRITAIVEIPREIASALRLFDSLDRVERKIQPQGRITLVEGGSQPFSNPRARRVTGPDTKEGGDENAE